MDKRLTVDLTPKVHDILQNRDAYHEKYYPVDTFGGGPSLHFHRRALGLEGDVSEPDKLELIYAVLTSWGMDRLGEKGPKMKDFDIFKTSVKLMGDDLDTLRLCSPASMTPQSWSSLQRVFQRIEVMASGTSLVGNSKVMAHLLPNIVSPIDRAYTLKYLFGNDSIQNDLNQEWELMRKILADFFYPIANDTVLQSTAAPWISSQTRYPWDTSILKVVDNLVIGAMKQAGERTP